MPNVGEDVKQTEVVYSQWDCKMLIHFERLMVLKEVKYMLITRPSKPTPRYLLERKEKNMLHQTCM